MRRLLCPLFLCILSFCSCSKSPDSASSSPVPPGGGGGTNPPKTDSTAFKGVWITTSASTALNSRDNIRQTVATCKAAGITNLFVVVYNNAGTTYPSEVMNSLIGKPIKTEFSGRDPLQEIIDEAHAAGLKVHAWFEYGFAASYGGNGGPIVAARPQWAGKDIAGKLVSKNGFDWLNAFDPEVQNFLISLFKEVVSKYNVDGVQGDDRLPAMPTTGGYDDYTVELYRSEFNGATPPADPKEAAWVQWRAKKLNTFLKRLRNEVKAIKPTIQFTMAPSVYPFSLTEYLQDWPTWVDSAWVDKIMPQVYRYDLPAYTSTLTQMKSYLKGNNANLCYPGVLLKSGTYLPGDDFLTGMIRQNRTRGFRGEVFFFYEGVKDKLNFFTQQYPYIQ